MRGLDEFQIAGGFLLDQESGGFPFETSSARHVTWSPMEGTSAVRKCMFIGAEFIFTPLFLFLSLSLALCTCPPGHAAQCHQNCPVAAVHAARKAQQQTAPASIPASLAAAVVKFSSGGDICISISQNPPRVFSKTSLLQNIPRPPQPPQKIVLWKLEV